MHRLSSSVKVMVAIAILFTYPLQLTASNEVVWSGVQNCFSEKRQEFGYYLTRGLMIVGTGKLILIESKTIVLN